MAELNVGGRRVLAKEVQLLEILPMHDHGTFLVAVHPAIFSQTRITNSLSFIASCFKHLLSLFWWQLPQLSIDPSSRSTISLSDRRVAPGLSINAILTAVS